MRGSTNSNPLDVMNQNQLQQTTSGLTVALQTAPHTGILLVRIHTITATDMMYIRVYDKNGNENRQYGSYATGGQQIMIPGYIQKGEKFRITGATGSIVIPYLVFVGGGIKALLGKACALLQEVLSHAGRYQCDKQGTAIHRLAYSGRKMDTQRGRRRGMGRWSIGRCQLWSIDHSMHRDAHKIARREHQLFSIRPIGLGHMSLLYHGGRDHEIQLEHNNVGIWDGIVQYRMTKGLVA